MKPHPEHQQDHADLGQLIGDFLVGDVARRKRPDENPSQQIAHQGRQSQALGDGAQRERGHEARDNGGDQRRVVGHEPPENLRFERLVFEVIWAQINQNG